ncbi:MAG: 16S rRNA (cytosine(1402)-N(4))-methyltransferase RsmH [Candidatus Komeilibacteria bacterium]|nr:16S rRNA (cytosine(1402)-N(4))-methyltransferase RsmH [Candidatus Komeilibacteria bacterium]
MADHVPVLLTETIAALRVTPNMNYIDCTVGAGGHAEAILKLNGPEGKVYGIDADDTALTLAKKNLKKYGHRLVLVQGNYRSLETIAREEKIESRYLGGIYADLGLSTMQLESQRGFSFQTDTPLEMSFSNHGSITAAEIINHWSEEEIGKILRDFGEEERWRSIAATIVRQRSIDPITTTGQLSDLVKRVKSSRHHNPATKTFQALRIAVNDELEGLRELLPAALNILPSGGRLTIISYHSLEDRIVKNFFREEAKDCVCPPNFPHCICDHRSRVKLITKKPITPMPEEIKINPRSRSAKLRVAARV